MRHTPFFTLILIYIILFFTLPYTYQDPDSYFYDSIAKGYIPSDGTTLGDILHDFGSIGGKSYLFFISLTVIIMMYIIILMVSKSQRLAWISAGFLMFTPFSLIYNSWFGRMDKNIVEIGLFLIFLSICTVYRNGGRYWFLKYIGLSCLFYPIAFSAWQGAKFFIVMQMLYIIAYEFFIMDRMRITWHTSIMTAIFSGICIYFRDNFPGMMSLVAEGKITLFHLIQPELILFLILFLNRDTFKRLNNELPSVWVCSLLMIPIIFILPRMMLLILILIPFLMIYTKDLLTTRNVLIALCLIVVMDVAYIVYFQKDRFEDIREIDDPCMRMNYCTLITDWSYGIIYENIWHDKNVSVRYSGHPNDIMQVMDMMYYKNATCSTYNMTDCVYLWHPRDYDVYDMYADRLGMPRSDQERYDIIHLKRIYEVRP